MSSAGAMPDESHADTTALSKKSLSESDIRLQYIDPALAKHWDKETQIRTEYVFTAGRVEIHGKTIKRGKQCRADYILFYKPNIPLAIVEAKDNNHAEGEGLQQAIRYAEMLDIPFAYSSNGDSFVEHDFLSGHEGPIALGDFPSPDELWARYCAAKCFDEKQAGVIATPFHYDPVQKKSPRYYQRVAVSRVVEAIASGKKRALLVMATGTGKTYTAFQIIHRLRESGLVKHALFITDRNILVDQTMMQDFKPFGSAMTKVTGRKFDPAYEIHLALYHQFVGANGEKYYTEFQREFFDLIIVDECHRGSAKEDSAWREILEYFNDAIHVGMTATPRTEEDGNNLEHFGNPVYTYPLKQGISDGFLAPYKVIRVRLDLDHYGWTPDGAMLDDNGNEIEERAYSITDFDKNIEIKNRTLAVAKRVTQWMHENGPMSKAIVFCVNTDHAQQMRNLIAALNPEEMEKDSRYVMRITGNDAEGREQLDNFISVDSQYPVIATTSQMLTTGVDCKMCKLIVLDTCIKSMTVFKQIVGRGTRLLWNDEDDAHDKRFFTVMDFRNATRHFADEEFDGEIEVIEEAQCPKCHEFPCICDKMLCPECGQFPCICEHPPIDLPPIPDGGDGDGPLPTEPPEEPKPPKPSIIGPEVGIEDEIVQITGPDGKLRTVSISTFREGVLKTYPSIEEFRAKWDATLRKREILDELGGGVLDFDEIRHKLPFENVAEMDEFDLICHIVFDKPPMTRAERAKQAKESDIFDKYSEQAREVLFALLDKYAETGAMDLGDLNVFSNDPFKTKFGSGPKIASFFGGKAQLEAAMAELEQAIYAPAA